MRLIVIAAALLALAACKPAPHQSATNEAAAPADVGPHKGVDRSHKGEVAPDVTISFGGKEAENFGDLRGGHGIPTLVNLWATWCAPCVKELPTLNRLAQAHENDSNFQVVAISQDDGPHQSVEAFLKAKAPNLEPYQDPKMALSAVLGPDTVLPTTILYDANGKEVWRYVGDLDWTSAEAAKLLAEGGVAAPKKG